MTEPSTRPHQPFWTVACPHCGAAPGHACRTPDGIPRAIPCVARLCPQAQHTSDAPKVAQEATQAPATMPTDQEDE